MWIIWRILLNMPISNAMCDGKICEPDFSPGRPIIIDDEEDKWFEQKLDHFNSANNVTWKQRYQVNQLYYKRDGPIFLYIGGKGLSLDSWLKNGAGIEYAEELNALCFQLEHRYYGKSRPTKDLSTENLVYLTMDQALADYATFIVNIRTKYDIPDSAKWIVFGCSYPGLLAAWMRVKYPHLVYATVSSSGPSCTQIDVKDYYKAVEKIVATYDTKCVTRIREANQMIYDHLKTTDGKKIITTKFKLCDPLDEYQSKGFESLFEVLASNFAKIVQYNKIMLFDVDNYLAWETLCDIMVSNSISTSLDRYAAVHSLILAYFELNCTHYNYTKTINSYSNTSWDHNELGYRQWLYQSCTELGFFRTSNKRSAFGNQFPLNYFLKMCSDVFGNTFSLLKLSSAVKRINTKYGELSINEDHIIYIQGSMDPWNVLGMTRTISKKSVLVYINGSSNCADVYQSNPKDVPELNDARELIKAQLSEWLMENDIWILFQILNVFIYPCILYALLHNYF